MEKLSYHVAHLSGQDENLSGKELEDQSPTSKGWRSSRFCLYPQEIVLSLSNPSRIRMIQVLSHQFLIATKIEVFLGVGSTDNPQSLQDATFKRLGYFCFKENDSSNYKSRELKSVHVDGKGCFIKLLIHKNHINPHNLYNQVCLIAVNVLGYHQNNEREALLEKKKDVDNLINSYMMQGDELKSDAVLKGRMNRVDYISPLHDLAFDLCQDPETAQLIRKLDHKKAKAVIEERYDYAKKLKAAIEDLKVVGEKLGKWEVEKRRAAEMEDYELAKIKKLQSDEYRLFIYKQLDLFDLLEIKKGDPSKQKPQDEPLPFKIRGKGPKVIGGSQLSPLKSPENQRAMVPSELSPNTEGQDFTSPFNSPRNANGYSMLDDRIMYENSNDRRALPVHYSHKLNSSGGATELSGILERDSENENGVILDDPLPLTDKELEEAGPIIDTFGMHLAKCIYSKLWQHRQTAAILAVSEMEKEIMSGLLFEADSKLILQGAIQFTLKLLKDQVFSIFNQSINVTLVIFKILIPKLKISKSETGNVIDKVLPLFLHRCGDSSVRVRQSIIGFVYELAMIKEIKVKQQICAILTGPFDIKGQIPWRIFKSRLEIIQKLLESWDPNSADAFEAAPLLEFLAKGLKHSSREVRDAAVDCLLIMYKKVGNQVKHYLPPDDTATRRNPLYSKIFDAFDRIDGVPTEAERKAMDKMLREETDKAKRKQISSLQNKLKALAMIAEESDSCKSTSAQSSPRSVIGKKANIATGTENDPKSEKIQDVDKICVFCGQHDDAFKKEQAIEKHYWRTCPMLRRCNLCPQVFEIAKTNHHFLNECGKKEQFSKCADCGTSILSSDVENHHKSNLCKEITNIKPNCCPLCRGTVSDEENAWRAHLIGECKSNSIRLQQIKAQGELIKNQLQPKNNLTNLNASVKLKKKIMTPRRQSNKTGKKTVK